MVFYAVLIIAQWEIEFEICSDNSPEYHPSTSLAEFINSLIKTAYSINCILPLTVFSLQAASRKIKAF